MHYSWLFPQPLSDDALRLNSTEGASIVAVLKAQGAVANREGGESNIVSSTSPSAPSVLEVHWSDIELLDRLGGGSFGDVYRYKSRPQNSEKQT